jgi:hypothetical protein
VTVVVADGGLAGGQSYVTTALITGVANAVATTTLKTGACQSGWLSCGRDVGGGCCPPQYGCGTVCSATGGGYTGVVSKIEPSSATIVDLKNLMLAWLFSLCVGIMMI